MCLWAYVDNRTDTVDQLLIIEPGIRHTEYRGPISEIISCPISISLSFYLIIHNFVGNESKVQVCRPLWTKTVKTLAIYKWQEIISEHYCPVCRTQVKCYPFHESDIPILQTQKMHTYRQTIPKLLHPSHLRCGV